MVNTLEFTKSNGVTLKLTRKYIEENTHFRSVTGEKIVSDDGLLIDLLTDGAYLIMDMNFEVNKSLVEMFTTSFDPTKQFALSFNRNTTTNTYNISEALKQINYTGSLPLTDLKEIFCTVFDLRYRSGLSTDELVSLMESVYDRKVAGLPPVVIPPIPVVPTTNELTTLMGNVFDAKYAALAVAPVNKKPFVYVYKTTGDTPNINPLKQMTYDAIYKKVGTGVDYNTSTYKFSIANPGMYLLTASLYCANAMPATIELLVKRESVIPIMARNTNIGNSTLLQTALYFGPNDFTFPVTDLIIEWGYGSEHGEQLGVALYSYNYNYTFAILQMLD